MHLLQTLRPKRRISALCAFAILARPITSFPSRSLFSSPTKGLWHRLYSTTTTLEEDPLKWERMYQDISPFDDLRETIVNKAPTISSQIRVITFDLDDTLWKTGATITAANDALAAHLSSINIKQPKRTELVMGDLFLAEKDRYAPVQGEEAAAPVLLTLLRKDAIAYIATEYNNYTLEEALPLADQAFLIWKQALHDAIPSNLAESVHQCLEELSRLTTTTGDKVVIGAITDGNADPNLVADIGKFFDFRVSAEQVGVGKPHPAIYAHAIQWVRNYWLQTSDLKEDLGLLIDPESSLVGPWWVHIGDDFVKDIVAVKDINARSVWSRELVLHKMVKVVESQDDETAKPDKSLLDFQKEISSQTVVKMQIGSEDYLSESLEKEFADGVVDSFKDVARLLTEWHEQGLAKMLEATNEASSSLHHEAEAQSMGQHDSVVDARTSKAGAKYCMSCGEKVAVNAKFCASCGEPIVRL
jgi:FMN phosphatase YigB (HAD superfamily)